MPCLFKGSSSGSLKTIALVFLVHHLIGGIFWEFGWAILWNSVVGRVFGMTKNYLWGVCLEMVLAFPRELTTSIAEGNLSRMQGCLIRQLVMAFLLENLGRLFWFFASDKVWDVLVVLVLKWFHGMCWKFCIRAFWCSLDCLLDKFLKSMQDKFLIFLLSSSEFESSD